MALTHLTCGHLGASSTQQCAHGTHGALAPLPESVLPQVQPVFVSIPVRRQARSMRRVVCVALLALLAVLAGAHSASADVLVKRGERAAVQPLAPVTGDWDRACTADVLLHEDGSWSGMGLRNGDALLVWERWHVAPTNGLAPSPTWSLEGGQWVRGAVLSWATTWPAHLGGQECTLTDAVTGRPLADLGVLAHEDSTWGWMDAAR